MNLLIIKSILFNFITYKQISIYKNKSNNIKLKSQTILPFKKTNQNMVYKYNYIFKLLCNIDNARP